MAEAFTWWLINNYVLERVLDKIVGTSKIEKFDDTRILVVIDNILSDNIPFKNVVIKMASVVKDGDAFYPQLFLEGELFNKYTQRKALKEKISKELMPLTWHSTRWLNWCLSRKGVEPIFTDEVGKF